MYLNEFDEQDDGLEHEVQFSDMQGDGVDEDLIFKNELLQKLDKASIKLVSDTSFMSREEAFHETFLALGNNYRELMLVIGREQNSTTRAEFMVQAEESRRTFKALASKVMTKVKRGEF